MAAFVRPVRLRKVRALESEAPDGGVRAPGPSEEGPRNAVTDGCTNAPHMKTVEDPGSGTLDLSWSPSEITSRSLSQKASHMSFGGSVSSAGGFTLVSNSEVSNGFNKGTRSVGQGVRRADQLDKELSDKLATAHRKSVEELPVDDVVNVDGGSGGALQGADQSVVLVGGSGHEPAESGVVGKSAVQAATDHPSSGPAMLAGAKLGSASTNPTESKSDKIPSPKEISKRKQLGFCLRFPFRAGHAQGYDRVQSLVRGQVL